MTRRILTALVAAVLLAGCAVRPGVPVVTAPAAPTSEPTPATSTATAPAVTAPLAQLVIDDHPAPGEPYRRDLYKTWLDPDGNGCDAREDALIRADSTSVAPVVTGPGCKIISGYWLSQYDSVEGSDPGAFDIDHVVPLAEVHRSGGASWSTERRAQIANDPRNLVVASAHSNRSKGDKDPGEWRPPLQSAWCPYARQYLDVKITYGLTADTRERDALGAMLDTCPKEG